MKMFITPVQLSDLLPESYLQVCNLLSSLCQFFGRTNYFASSLLQLHTPLDLQQPEDALKSTLYYELRVKHPQWTVMVLKQEY